jgi:hypothetical protein
VEPPDFNADRLSAATPKRGDLDRAGGSVPINEAIIHTRDGTDRPEGVPEDSTRPLIAAERGPGEGLGARISASSASQR